MDEKTLEISFSIISFAGDSKSLALESIKEAKNGNIDEAREILKRSKEQMVKAHEFQMNLIQNEASGNKMELGILLIHAQDHLMNAITFQDLAGEFIDLYETLHDNQYKIDRLNFIKE